MGFELLKPGSIIASLVFALLGVAVLCSFWIDPTNKLQDPVAPPPPLNGMLHMAPAK